MKDFPHTQDRGFWFGNTRVEVRLSCAAGEDAISVVEHRMRYGEAPPLHVHHHEDEVFHVLEGTLRVRIGDDETILRAGDIGIAPKGIPHGFRVESLSGARCLTICRGGDFESLLMHTGRPATAPGLPAHQTPDAVHAEAFAEICAAYGIDLIGPPLAPRS